MNHPTMPRRRNLIVTATATLAAALVLTGCATTSPEPESISIGSQAVDTEFLTDHNLDGLDATQVIGQLDTMPVAAVIRVGRGPCPRAVLPCHPDLAH